MALIIEYEDPYEGFIDITGYVKWGQGEIHLTMTAEQGSVNTDSITVQDPNGIFDFNGLRNFSVKESESEFERIYIGWVWVKHVSRGDYYRTGPGRVWELELQDINHRLYQNVMAGNDTDRPAETDVERIQWLLTTGEASGFTDTTTYVFTDRPVDMDAVPDAGYNGQMFNQVVDDCAQQSGKNYYVIDIFDEYLGYKLGIWYGHDDLDEFVSEATISNVLSEVDNVTVFWADVSAKLDRDPSRVYSGMFANYDGGWVYRQRAETVTEFTHRDTVANWSNVKTATKANARADRILADLAANGEEDAVTVTIFSMLPSQANIFRAGHRVNGVKFSHFPGWEFGRDVRIVRKTITDQSEQFYSMELDLLPIGPPVTCGMAISTVDVWNGASSGVGAWASPQSFTPDAPPFDGIQVGLFLGRRFGDTMGTGDSASVDDDFTDAHNSRNTAGATFDWQTLGAAGWRRSEGDTGTMSTAWSASVASEVIGMCATFNVGSTAPLQVSPVTEDGTSFTFDNPVTPGSIIVGISVNEAPSQSGAPLQYDGFDLIGYQWVNEGNLLAVVSSIQARCATVDDSETIVFGGGTFSHWQWGIEIAP